MNLLYMNKLFGITIILTVILSLGVFAKGDLIITTGTPEVLLQTGFEQDVFIPYTITNIGDEPVTSRFSLKMPQDNQWRGGSANPLYTYTGDIKTVGGEFKYPQGVPIIGTDDIEYFQKAVSNDIFQKGEYVSTAPTITLKPNESLPFTVADRGFFNIFSVADSGEHTFTYVVDPDNEVDEQDETNNEVTVTLNVSAPTVVKGPNTQFKLSDNQYWFFFKNLGDCVDLETPGPTKICLVSEGVFTAKLTINNEQVNLYYLFNIFSFDKQVENLVLSAGEDGFFLTYK
ncbi:hypothetical protein COV12_02575 [Candidatus Woesearchaeota archaeon CG10_big_fil_rev_8_21_14_0_10_32_24]|nr:MAG: hypothetical protein COV12_02575 [Candidatus Woesearchaeota archaeon CG10_big_fil_rev_8_21_14_0_10_32_24]